MTETGLLCRRTLAIVLATSLAFGGTFVFAADSSTTGLLAGRVTDDSKRPFLNYAVQLRDASTGKVFVTVPVNGQGQFAFKEVPLNKRYLVELVRAKTSAVLCTSGPYSASNDPKTPPVRLGCGRPPAAYWVLAAAAGTGAFYALSTRATGVGAGSVTATNSPGTSTNSVSK